MSLQKSIIIGCDNSTHLSCVMNGIKENHFFSHNIITATRIPDLLGIVRSLAADLVILCFRNNQLVLNDFNFYVKKAGIPILCLTEKYDSSKLKWNKNNIVFTCPLEYISNEEFLSSRIHSIFLLNSEPAMKRANNDTLAEAAFEQNQNNSAKNLSRYVMELDQKVEVLLKIKERIANLYPAVDDHARTELISIVNSIKLSANDTKLWDDFKMYFESTNPDFLFLLAQKHPELTPKDLKYCCYLKMNMTNDDIRNLLGINQESVRTHKYRLKKKMDLPRDTDLISYLRHVDQK